MAKELAIEWWNNGRRFNKDNLLSQTWDFGSFAAPISIGGCSAWGNHSFALYTIVQHGSKTQFEKFNTRTLSDLMLSFVLTEERIPGSRLTRIETNITRRNEKIILNTAPNSCKKWIGNGITSHAIVCAKFNNQLVWVIVDNSLPGVTIETIPGCFAVKKLNICKIQYKDVELKPDDILTNSMTATDIEFFFSTFRFERIAIASMVWPVITRNIARIIVSHERIKPFEINNLYGERYECWKDLFQSLDNTVRHLLHTENNLSILEASVIKCCFTWAGKLCMSQLRELGGAAAMFEMYGLKQDEAEIDLMCTFGGDNTILSLYVLTNIQKYAFHSPIRSMFAKWLMFKYRKQHLKLAKKIVWLIMHDLICKYNFDNSNVTKITNFLSRSFFKKIQHKIKVLNFFSFVFTIE